MQTPRTANQSRIADRQPLPASRDISPAASGRTITPAANRRPARCVNLRSSTRTPMQNSNWHRLALASLLCAGFGHGRREPLPGGRRARIGQGTRIGRRSGPAAATGNDSGWPGFGWPGLRRVRIPQGQVFQGATVSLAAPSALPVPRFQVRRRTSRCRSTWRRPCVCPADGR